MRSAHLITVFCLIMFFSISLFADEPNTEKEMPIFISDHLGRHLDQFPVSTIPIQKSADETPKTVEEWRDRIDAAWGQSELTKSTQLTMFNNYWTKLSDSFPAFQYLDLDFDSLRQANIIELNSGPVSRGRFAAIMQYTAKAVSESHTNFFDWNVLGFVNPQHNRPLLMLSSYVHEQHFGAGLSLMPDSSLFVYDVINNHPMGLEVGDIIIGYDGQRWKDLYPILLEAQLPILGPWGSSEEATTHILLTSAGLNWHLYDSMTVVKYATGDTISLSTSLMANKTIDAYFSEQLPVPGIPAPFPDETEIVWGIIDNTNFGYLYATGWGAGSGVPFTNAVDSMLDIYNVEAIIFDFRVNNGGSMFQCYEILERMLSDTTATIAFYDRLDPNDRTAMFKAWPEDLYQINADPTTNVDIPMAVLCGPNALSAGDQVPNLFRLHPRVRTFGKKTSTAFTAATYYDLYPNYYFLGSFGNSAPAYATDTFLTHTGFPIDEEVWLTQEDAVNGVDAVVKAATAWIEREIGLFFEADLTVGQAPLEVAFSARSPYDVDLWEWDFGDATISNEANPIHTFSNPGIYDVSLAMTSGTIAKSKSKPEYILVTADSLKTTDQTVTSGQSFAVDIALSNLISISEIFLPIEYSGEISLMLDSIVYSGTRATIFETRLSDIVDPFNKQLSLHLFSAEDHPSNHLPPGSGTLVKLYFTPSMSDNSQTNMLVFDGFSNHTLRFNHGGTYYTPDLEIGAISGNCCRGIRGNANGDEEDILDIEDLVFMVDYQFRNGEKPACDDEADVNGDKIQDVADLVYLVDYMFNRPGGKPPIDCIL